MTTTDSRQEDIRFIECDCGEWEQFPADMARHKSQTFGHIENMENGEASYKCLCGTTVTSKCKTVDIED